MTKRILSLLLALTMVWTMLPFSALATETDPASGTPATQDESAAEPDTSTGTSGDAVSGTCGDNLTWVLEDGILTISGEGEMADCTDSAPWTGYYEQITSIVIEEGITAIGPYAFMFLTEATSVEIPDTVTGIGESAFTFCTKLGNVQLPENLVSIGQHAFANTAITEITIPAKVETIGPGAFWTGNLQTINVDPANTIFYTWNGMLYTNSTLLQVPVTCEGTLELHDFTGTIENYALGSCTKLTNLVVPASVSKILQSDFSSCESLTEIVFNGDVPEINATALKENTLTISYPAGNPTWTDELKQSLSGNITWNPYGDNLVAYGYCGENNLYSDDYAWVGETTLDVIPGKNATWTVTSDGVMTFSGTGRLVDCHLGGNHPWLVIFYRDPEFVTKVVVEEGITAIGSFPFAMDQNITELVLPSTLRVLGGAALATMAKLEEIQLPDGLTKMYGYALQGCAALTALDIPASVTHIGNSALAELSSLEYIRFHGDAPLFGSTVMENTVATVYYPVNNETWTEDVMQQYGGTITWVSYANPEITAQPVDASAANGAAATVTVKATGTDLTYTWYYKNTGDSSFTKDTQATGNVYSVNMTAARDGCQVYCTVTDRFGNSVNTQTVTLTLRSTLAITKQLQNVTVKNGAKATVTLEAVGDGLTYTWYYKNAGSSKFSKTTTFKGASYSVTMSAERDGRQVYCVVTDKYGNTVTTDTVTLSMQVPLVITVQPVGDSDFAGEKVSATVKATGKGLTYQWYIKTATGSKYSKSSATGATYAFKMSSSANGRSAYCVITDAYGVQVQTDVVVFTMNVAAKINVQPADVTVQSGQKAVVTVKAEGDGLTYAWYFSDNGGKKFSKTSTFTGNTYSVKMSASRDGRQIYCVITDQYGNSVQTNTVTLRIQAAVE